MINEKNCDPALDEHIWQAWMKKNEALDRLRLARRLRLVALAIPIAAFTALLWRFA
jgi:hypothetical protein